MSNRTRAYVLTTLILLSTAFASITLGHSLPILQTVQPNRTYTEIAGPIEIYCPYKSDGTFGGINTSGATMLLRVAGTAATDCGALPLPSDIIACGKDGAVAALPVICPVPTFTDACARLALTLGEPLSTGAYELVYQVAHLDGYLERTVVRFTVDPTYVAPSPSPLASIRPSPTTSATPIYSITPSPSTVPSASNNSAAPTGTIPPATSLSPSQPTGSKQPQSPLISTNPSVPPTTIPDVNSKPRLLSQHDPYTLNLVQWGLLCIALPLVALASALTAREKRLL